MVSIQINSYKRNGKAMGRATRWVRTLFGRGKKEERNTTVAPTAEATKRWSLGKSWRDRGDGLLATVVVEKEEVRRRNFYLENEKERRRHAIAVANATTAAAQMALAAAQKAVAVVKLTSHRKCTMKAVDGGGERWAAVKIQSVFRGYLARKARRALKALVKLQALVRGHLFRKQMAIDFKSYNNTRVSHVLPLVDQTRRSLRALDERRKENLTSVGSSGDGPQVIEMDSVKHKTSSSDEQQDGCFSSFTRHVPPPIRTYDHRNTLESNESILVKKRRISIITQATPRLLSSIGHVSLATVVTPSPRSYMANTESFKAKVRSQAASRLMSGARSKNSPVETIEGRMSFNRNLMRSLSDVKDGRGFNCGSISS